MKTSWIAALMLAVGAAHGEGLQDLSWMAGSWMERKGGVETEEHWLAPKGGLMMAMNRTVVDGKATEFELLRIVMREGRPVYLSMPNGRPAVEFASVEQAANRIVFEDAGRDFPRRILYWRDGEALMARIEGTIKGEPRAKEWRFERMK
ncbi:MAG TPA: DUF6265 family protein [Usitatibacter sp.]|nr:DUF6265 family protein [Usitatibacter sp.]